MQSFQLAQFTLAKMGNLCGDFPSHPDLDVSFIMIAGWLLHVAALHDTTGYSATFCYQESASCVQCIDLAEDIAKQP